MVATTGAEGLRLQLAEAEAAVEPMAMQPLLARSSWQPIDLSYCEGQAKSSLGRPAEANALGVVATTGAEGLRIQLAEAGAAVEPMAMQQLQARPSWQPIDHSYWEGQARSSLGRPAVMKALGVVATTGAEGLRLQLAEVEALTV